MTYRTVSPYTNEVVAEYPFAADDEMDAAIAAGHRRYVEMKTESLAHHEAGGGRRA